MGIRCHNLALISVTTISPYLLCNFSTTCLYTFFVVKATQLVATVTGEAGASDLQPNKLHYTHLLLRDAH